MTEITASLIALVVIAMISISAVNILKSASRIISSDESIVISKGHMSWMLFFLFTHATFFWSVASLFENVSWTLPMFLIFIPGPVLLIFASGIISSVTLNEETDPHEWYLRISRKFLPVYAALLVWELITSHIFHPFESVFVGALFTLVVVLSLRFISSYRWHISGLVAVWIIFVYNLIMQII